MNVQEVVNNVFIDRFELEEKQLQPEARLREDLQLDSLDYIEMVVFIEKNIKIKLNRDELRNIITLQDVYTLVEKSINEMTKNQ